MPKICPKQRGGVLDHGNCSATTELAGKKSGLIEKESFRLAHVTLKIYVLHTGYRVCTMTAQSTVDTVGALCAKIDSGAIARNATAALSITLNLHMVFAFSEE